jgi:hypothetical protein
MENQETGWIENLLEEYGHQPDCGMPVVNRLVDLFNAAEKTLSPVVGRRGLVSLQYANLQRMSSEYPWLIAVTGNIGQSQDLIQSLKAALVEQSEATARQFGLDFLHSFYTTLVSLIGMSVTKTLLMTAWDVSSTENMRGNTEGYHG